MADIKWIKMATGLPGNRKIKQIRRLPDGDKIALMWVFMLCLAGDVNEQGLIYLTPEVPYTDEMLADEFDMDINVIRLGLEAFQRFGMIEIVDDIICLSSWEKWQAVDSMATIREQTRKRVAKHREKQRALLGVKACQYCGGVATGEDHIIARARGGSDADENKVPCCKDCNRIKNDKPLVDFLNANREFIRDDLIAGNEKLQRHVTLCNVTNRYIVTQCNATEEDIERDIDKELDNEDIIPDSDEPEPPAPKESKPVKHKYGEYNNVLLTDDELQKLKTEYSDWEERIERLSSYVASTGKSYKSHYATIRNWARKDAEKPGKKEIVPSWMNKGSFNNYDQRQYDTSEMSDVERKMLQKTAGNNPEIAARAEALKKQLS